MWIIEIFNLIKGHHGEEGLNHGGGEGELSPQPTVSTLVLILDGNSLKGAHVRSNLY